MQRSEKVKRRKGKRASTESLPPPLLSVSINANNRRLMSHSYLTTSNGKMPVCTCVLSVYFQGHRAEFHTVQNSSRVRQMAAYPDPPPVVPVPDTGVAQVTTSPGRGLLVAVSWRTKTKMTEFRLFEPGSAPARNVFRYWGSPRACYRIPCCE